MQGSADQRVTSWCDVRQVHRDLRVLDPAGSSAVLASRADGVRALLHVLDLIDDPGSHPGHRTPRLHRSAGHRGSSRTASQSHFARESRCCNPSGDTSPRRSAMVSSSCGPGPRATPASTPPLPGRLVPGEPGTDPVHQRAEPVPPAIGIYPVSCGHTPHKCDLKSSGLRRKWQCHALAAQTCDNMPTSAISGMLYQPGCARKVAHIGVGNYRDTTCGH